MLKAQGSCHLPKDLAYPWVLPLAELSELAHAARRFVLGGAQALGAPLAPLAPPTGRWGLPPGGGLVWAQECPACMSHQLSMRASQQATILIGS